RDTRVEMDASSTTSVHSPSISATGCSRSTCCETTLTMTMMGLLSRRPQTPQSQPQNSKEMNTAAEFMRAILPTIKVATNVPTTVAMASEAPETMSALEIDSNCMNAAMPVNAAVAPGPRYGMVCSSPAATAHAPALSRPIQRNAIHERAATSRSVTSSMNMYFWIIPLMSSRMRTVVFLFDSEGPARRTSLRLN